MGGNCNYAYLAGCFNASIVINKRGAKMNYWVNRISHEFPTSGVMLRYGYLTVGWNDSNIQLLEASNWGETHFKEQFHRTFPDLSNEDSLWRFLKEYEIGDIVIVPFPDEHKDKFSIVKIQGDAEAAKITDLVDIGFVRKVECLKADIPRKALTENMDSNLFACPKTTYGISDYADAIEALLR